uniref:PHB domain-containing protein n=1 Tax=Heterorhabditis bacteriophora TaxID=37862 RepID=A0A1I7WIJ4_HETBA
MKTHNNGNCLVDIFKEFRCPSLDSNKMQIPVYTIPMSGKPLLFFSLSLNSIIFILTILQIIALFFNAYNLVDLLHKDKIAWLLFYGRLGKPEKVSNAPIRFLNRAKPFMVKSVHLRHNGIIEETGEHFLIFNFPVKLFIINQSGSPLTLRRVSVESFRNGELAGQRSDFIGKVVENYFSTVSVTGSVFMKGLSADTCELANPSFIMVDVYVSLETESIDEKIFHHSFHQKRWRRACTCLDLPAWLVPILCCSLYFAVTCCFDQSHYRHILGVLTKKKFINIYLFIYFQCMVSRGQHVSHMMLKTICGCRSNKVDDKESVPVIDSRDTVLVLISSSVLSRSLLGHVFTALERTDLRSTAINFLKPPKETLQVCSYYTAIKYHKIVLVWHLIAIRYIIQSVTYVTIDESSECVISLTDMILELNLDGYCVDGISTVTYGAFEYNF